MPPYAFEDCQSCYFTVRTTPGLLSALVPAPLVANLGDLLTFYVGSYNISAPVPVRYLEAGILIPASYGETQGDYMPILFLDQALPIVLGREIWGFPKIDAKLEFVLDGQSLHARVSKGATTLIEAHLTLGENQLAAPTAPTSKKLFLLKSVPAVSANAPADVMKLNMILQRDIVNTEIRAGEGTLHLGSTLTEPLASIPSLTVVASGYTRKNFVLDYGETLYDYLTEREATIIVQ